MVFRSPNPEVNSTISLTFSSHCYLSVRDLQRLILLPGARDSRWCALLQLFHPHGVQLFDRAVSALTGFGARRSALL